MSKGSVRQFIFKIGKKTYFRLILLDFLVEILHKSRSEVKRLLDDGAVTIYAIGKDVQVENPKGGEHGR